MPFIRFIILIRSIRSTLGFLGKLGMTVHPTTGIMTTCILTGRHAFVSNPAAVIAEIKLIVGEGLRALPEPFCYSDIRDVEEMLLPCGASETVKPYSYALKGGASSSVGVGGISSQLRSHTSSGSYG